MRGVSARRIAPASFSSPAPAPEPVPEPSAAARGDAGVEGNARLTASSAAVLVVLLAAEGVTVLSVRGLLAPHVFIGMLLIPPVVLKIGSTGYRFLRYYRHAPAYRRKGPPPALLRLLGPFVVVSTVVVLLSGVALLYIGSGWRDRMLQLHKASFVLWFGAMTLHVLGHLAETARVAPRDWVRRSARDVSGAGARRWLLVVAVALGCLLGVAVLGRVAPWLAWVAAHRTDG